MSTPEILRLSFSDLGALEREIATNLRYGRVFVSEILDAPVLTEGVLVIVHPVDGSELHLAAQIVMVNSDGPMRGTGLALRSFGPNDVERVLAFAREHAPPRPSRANTAPPPPEPEGLSIPAAPEPAPPDPSAAVTVRPAEYPPPAAAEDDWSEVMAEPAQPLTAAGVTLRPEVESAAPPPDDPAAHAAAHELAEALAGPPPAVAEDDWSGVLSDEPQPTAAEEPAELDQDEDLDQVPGSDLQPETRQEKLRTLNPTEQLKLARRGELQDRVAIERLYGKQVWEALLENPRITPPEVARIARKGTVPRPLIESIVENNAWIKDVSVRRALLNNNKLTAEGIQKLLRITPRHELKTIEKGTAYPVAVREAARKLLRE